MDKNNIAIFTHLTTGEHARLTRLNLKLRQVDVASKANVTVQEVSSLENDGFVLPTRLSRIFKALGLSEDTNLGDTREPR